MVVFDKLPSETVRNYAIRVLKYNIVTLKLEPGSAISENELSKELNISRTPVREALIELTRLNILEILPQRGSYITKIDYDLVEESRFLRATVETAVYKLACQQITEDTLIRLERNLEDQKRVFAANDTDAFMELDNEFHRLVYEAVNKEWSYSIVKDQMIHFDRLRALSLVAAASEHTLRDHEDLLYALKRRDAEMCELMVTRHLTRHQFEKEELKEKFPDYFV